MTIIRLAKAETVVLIHGWFSNAVLMKPLEWRFNKAGFSTANFGYPSLRRSIEVHSQQFADFLARIDDASDGVPFHIVAHSMGSIVTRCVLQQQQFKNLGKIVMLCPPNRGSHAAQRVTTAIQGRCRTLDQISDHPDSFVNQLPTTTGQCVGIVIASGDLVVRKDAARMDDATDYAIVPGMHNTVLFKPKIAELCIRFLKTGRFSLVHHKD